MFIKFDDCFSFNYKFWTGMPHFLKFDMIIIGIKY